MVNFKVIRKDNGSKSCFIRKYDTYYTLTTDKPLKLNVNIKGNFFHRLNRDVPNKTGLGFFINHSLLRYQTEQLVFLLKQKRNVFILINNLLIYNEEFLAILNIIISDDFDIDDKRRFVWLMNEIKINGALFLNISITKFKNIDWSLPSYFEYIDIIASYIINMESETCDAFRQKLLEFCHNRQITIEHISQTRKAFFDFYQYLRH